MARNPKYKLLFGPVSISNRYSSFSRVLLANFLKIHTYLPELGRWIEPTHPLKARGRFARHDLQLAGTVVRSVDEVNELIAEIERDRKHMPVLLRQYLKLNAQLLGLNVDPAFGDVLDGLMLVDLTRVDKRTLGRYLGRDNVDAFLAHHGVDDAASSGAARSDTARSDTARSGLRQMPTMLKPLST